MFWIEFPCLLFFASIIVSVVMETRVPASEAFNEVEYPCAANCGSVAASCFPSAWDEAATQSKTMTKGCTYVLYSAAIDDRADSFNPVGDFWEESKKCSILFLSKNSVYLQQHENASRVGNWNIVPVGKWLSSEFGNGRKASRVPKLSPGKFFAATVQYALYIDAKLLLLKHPAEILSNHLNRSRNISIVMVSNFPYIIDLTNEIRLIGAARSKRPTVTHDFNLLVHQGEVYASHNITGAGLAVDGALIMMDLRSPAATQFMCMWFNQLLKFSDRDQVAFQGALYYFSHTNNDSVVDSEGIRNVALDTTYGQHYLRILPSAKFWWNADSKEFAERHRRSWNRRHIL